MHAARCSPLFASAQRSGGPSSNTGCVMFVVLHDGTSMGVVCAPPSPWQGDMAEHAVIDAQRPVDPLQTAPLWQGPPSPASTPPDALLLEEGPLLPLDAPPLPPASP